MFRGDSRGINTCQTTAASAAATTAHDHKRVSQTICLIFHPCCVWVWVCTALPHAELCPTAVGSRCSAVIYAGNLFVASHCCVTNSLTGTTTSSSARTWVVHPVGVTGPCTDVMDTGASVASSSHGWQNPPFQISSMLIKIQQCCGSIRFAYDPHMSPELFAVVAVVRLRTCDPMHVESHKFASS